MENNKNLKNVDIFNKNVIPFDRIDSNTNKTNIKRNETKSLNQSISVDTNKGCGQHNNRHNKPLDVLQVINGMKDRIHQLLDENKQLNYENNELVKKLLNK